VTKDISKRIFVGGGKDYVKKKIYQENGTGRRVCRRKK